MEMSFQLKNHKLFWVLPEQVKNLCARCGSDQHLARDCDAFPSRGRDPTPKSLLQNYERFKPEGFKPKRQRSRSASRSRSRGPRNTTHAPNNLDPKTATTQQPNRGNKSVTYGNTDDLSLNGSLHSPNHGRSNSKSPARPNIRSPATNAINPDIIKQLQAEIQNAYTQFQGLRIDF